MLREIAASSSARVVAVSPIDNVYEASNLGAAAFLQKPLDPFRLLSTVRDLTSSQSRKSDLLIPALVTQNRRGHSPFGDSNPGVADLVRQPDRNWSLRPKSGHRSVTRLG